MYLPSNRDTPVNLQTTPRLVEAVAPNEMGIYISKQANLKYGTLRNLTFTDTNKLNPIAVSWIDFLGNRGYSLSKGKSKGIVGIGIEKGAFIARYYPGLDFLVAETNYHDKIARSMPSELRGNAEAIEADKQYAILHEIAHALGVPGTRKGEHLQGLLQEEFYTMLANGAKGTKKERIYRELARRGRAYAEMFSLKNMLLGKLPEGNREDHVLYRRLLEKVVAEAEALELEGEEAAAYVKARVKSTYGALADDAGNQSKTSSIKSNSRDLEARVREDPKEASSEKAEAEAKEAPSEAAE